MVVHFSSRKIIDIPRFSGLSIGFCPFSDQELIGKAIIKCLLYELDLALNEWLNELPTHNFWTAFD